MSPRFFPLFAVGVSLVTLCACSTVSNVLQPNWMPRGYAHQDNTPLSSPAPTAPWSDDAVIHNTDKMAASTAAWQGAVFELLDKATPFIPQDGAPLIVTTVPPYAPLDLSFDHYLRQGLMRKGYTLTTTAGTAPLLVFDIAPLTDASALKTAQSEAGFVAVKEANVNGMYLLSLIVQTPDGKTQTGKAYTTAVFPYENDTTEGWTAGKATTAKPLGYNQ